MTRNPAFIAAFFAAMIITANIIPNKATFFGLRSLSSWPASAVFEGTFD